MWVLKRVCLCYPYFPKPGKCLLNKHRWILLREILVSSFDLVSAALNSLIIAEAHFGFHLISSGPLPAVDFLNLPKVSLYFQRRAKWFWSRPYLTQGPRRMTHSSKSMGHTMCSYSDFIVIARLLQMKSMKLLCLITRSMWDRFALKCTKISGYVFCTSGEPFEEEIFNINISVLWKQNE